MQTTWKLLFVAIVVPLTGCHHYGFLVKRDQELACPTDIRQTIPWCAGEDAVFYCPCGPSNHYYGMRPPGWRHWPTSGAEWRDAYGAMPTAHCQTATELEVPDEQLMMPTDAIPEQVAPPKLPLEPATEEAAEQETRAINPGYEGLGPFGASPLPSEHSTTRSQRTSENRRAKSLDIARDSWINH